LIDRLRWGRYGNQGSIIDDRIVALKTQGATSCCNHDRYSLSVVTGGRYMHTVDQKTAIGHCWSV